MNILKVNENLIFNLILLVFLLFGGISGQNLWFCWTSTFLLSVLVLFTYFDKGKLTFPRTFSLYIVFLGFFLISLFWTKDMLVSIKHFLNFISGGLIWLLIHNLKDKGLKPNLPFLTIALGIIFGLWFFYTRAFGIYVVESYNLVNYSVQNFTHHHVGDLWSVVAAVTGFSILKSRGKNIYLWLIAIFGLVLLALSFSRSAYVALASGGAYFLYKNSNYLKKNIFPILVFTLIIGLFFAATSQKSLIGHRLFYVQAVSGIFKNPFGVGMGNFSTISLDSTNHLFGIDAYAGVADNIFLEIFVGMGVFGLTFIYWFAETCREIFGKKGNFKELTSLIFVVLAVNFQFNYIYFIPTMLWLWFICIAVAVAKKNKRSNI